MNSTYALLAIPFLVLALSLWLVAVRRTRATHPTFLRSTLIALAGLLILTAVFDSVIVGTGLVAYDSSLTLGVYIGQAPIEDFAYTVVAGLGLPALWVLLPYEHE